MVCIQSQAHASLAVDAPNSTEENGTLFHVEAAFLQTRLDSVGQSEMRQCAYPKAVDFLPCLGTDEAEFIGRHPYYRAVLVMQ